MRAVQLYWYIIALQHVWHSMPGMVQKSVIMFTIDELAHNSGMPSRTIRFYNTQGMLPPPAMRGRVAYYGEEHLLVLNIIKELKERQNLPLETIKQLLEIRARYGDVQMNLALKQRLLRPLTRGITPSLSFPLFLLIPHSALIAWPLWAPLLLWLISRPLSLVPLPPPLLLHA